MGNKKDKTSGTIIGSNGMQEEYDLSKSHGNFLIPVGATGYKTKDLWYNMIRQCPCRSGRISVPVPAFAVCFREYFPRRRYDIGS